MPTLTGRNTRTITHYVATLLEYPRWVIEREVDFTNCRHGGEYERTDTQCTSCHFGRACYWLNLHRAKPTLNSPLDELIDALDTAVQYLRSPKRGEDHHAHDCECDSCQWVHEAKSFLRLHRHKT